MWIVLAFLTFIVSVWSIFFAGSHFIAFCLDYSDRWWGGYPLWMAGALGVFVPLVGVAIVLTLYIAGWQPS
jgi:hypothetical protein